MRPVVPVILLAATLGLAACSRYSKIVEKRPRLPPMPPGSAVLTLAEQTIAKALKQDRGMPLVAIGELLDAAAAASKQLSREPRDAGARRAYNFAISRVFTALRDAKIAAWESPLRVPGAQGEWLLSGRTEITREPILPLLEFIPADQLEVGGTYMKQRFTKDGIGAPLVARLRDTSDALKRDAFVQGKEIYYGITAVAKFEGRRCIVSFEDPLAKDEVTLAGHRQQLAADFTAPLAVALASQNVEKFELLRLLNPEKYAGTARLARLQPYDPTKIPVLCVHGLASSPATWAPLITALRADPEIRRRYQFWFYSHPSGYPYPYSAAILRKNLDAINARYPGHRKMVLIGHSMGGMISRLMVTDSGDKLWLRAFGKPPAQTPLSPQERKLAESILVFRHRSEFSRVIFIAAPHRGSDTASGWMSRIGSKLVRSPSDLLKAGSGVMKASVFQAGDLKVSGIPNSLDTLAPNNRFVTEVNKIPITPGIPFHSIMGDRGKGGNKDHIKPLSTDGLVPYWSSHLDGAKSELIVPSDHGAHQHPQAIAEVRRILMLNAAGRD